MSFPAILLLIYLISYLSFKLVTIIHELGHAIPGMMFTKAGATIYIGSYGNTSESSKLSYNNLTIYLSKNLFNWQGGLCILEKNNLTITQGIIQIIMGPLLPVILGAATFTFASLFNWHGSLKFVSVIFLGVTIFSMLQSLVPSAKQMVTTQGRRINNDGRQLLKLIRLRKIETIVNHAVQLYDEEDYEQAAEIFHREVLKDIKEPEYFKLATSAYLMSRQYQLAVEVSDEHQQLFILDADDLANAGLAHSFAGENDTAVEYYLQAIKICPEHKYALNNYAFTLKNMAQYEQAIDIFDKAIIHYPDFAYAYSNRGLSKIMLGDHDSGLADINYSFSLEPENAFALRNLGIYHLQTGNPAQALELFEKARSISPITYQIDEYILQAESAIK
ncbi:tetratricopeptide repeat protein [Pedobacter sp. BMA]|uniref:tetratricopeptide repeat protein n=1 Tax=Pedobacter sp. BMA TaxID=1663685 RepID=UPI0006494519|nr:tetratricopeptide repeat protein [Pedobacter sp. BMA]KLT67035.1 hypothetical protein AB669_03730 [Pedobacter sp. BMA]